MTAKPQKPSLPAVVTSTALTTSCLTLVVSLVYLVLSILGLVYRALCSDASPDDVRGPDFLINVLQRLYIVDERCVHAITGNELLPSSTVFIFIILNLILAVLSIATAIGLLTVIYVEDLEKYISAAVYSHVGVYVSVLVLDVIVAVFFGLDYGKLNNLMSGNSAGFSMNYSLDMQRLSAGFLLSLSVKGCVYHLVTAFLVTLLLVYVLDYNAEIKNQHPIHKLGAINGYEQPRGRHDDGWQPQPDMFVGLANRSQHVNPSFVPDDDFHPRSPRDPARDPSVSDYSSRLFDRSESWQARSAQSGSRPFSYLGDNRSNYAEPNRPAYLNDINRSPSYLNENRPAARAPPVPAPDYSPPTGRRLKSALKPNYQY